MVIERNCLLYWDGSRDVAMKIFERELGDISPRGGWMWRILVFNCSQEALDEVMGQW